MRSSALIAMCSLAACSIEATVGQNLPPDDTDLPARIDRDQDGFTYDEGDCDDDDPEIGPGEWFDDYCDGKDNDCNQQIDDDPVSGVHVCARSASYLQTLRLDVVFVIDSSQSMTPFHERTAQGATAFLQQVVGPAHDTHIGVLAMDMHHPLHQGRLVEAPTPTGAARWLEGDEVSVEAAKDWLISAILDTEVLLWGEEGGRAVVNQAITVQADDVNSGFFRGGADLVLVAISNDEDKSVFPSTLELLDTLDDFKGSLSQVTVHSIVQLDDQDCVGQYSPATRGASYVDLAAMTSGTTLSICEPDYDQYLATVGQVSANQGLSSRFALPRPAQDAQTTKVKLVFPGGTERILSYDDGEYALIDGNTSVLLLVDPLPPPDTQILVDYLEDF